jgi:hypothetical protein
MLQQLCLNWGIKGKSKIPENYDEYYDYFGGKEDYSVRVPIGIEFKSGNPILFQVNPLDMISLELQEETVYYEQKLLFEYLGEQPREIFVCLMRELENNKEKYIQFNSQRGEGEIVGLLFKTYYPNLFEQKIQSFDTFINENPKLTLKNYDNETKIYKNVDLFYAKPSDILLEEGIREFTMYISPDTTKKFPPLEIIFKNIHASKTVPLIYYQTNISNTFRLYCDKISSNGKKIPFLERSRINRLWREMDKNKKISGITKLKDKDKITLYIQDNTIENVEIFLDFK